MKATEKPLLQFMEGSEKCFIIPVYQRNYDWAVSHCGRLFDDLLDIIKNKHVGCGKTQIYRIKNKLFR